jgi:hypothetical protein
MSMARTPIPFRPDRDAAAREWRTAFVQRAAIKALIEVNNKSEADVLQDWSNDPTAKLARRSAVQPLKTSDLPGSNIIAFKALAPNSPAVAVLAAGEQFDLTGINQVEFPLMQSFTSADWVAPGDPIKVGQGVFSSMTLGPMCALKMIVGLSSALETASAGQASSIIERAVEIAIGRGLAAKLFSTDPAVPGLSPAGLLLNAAAVVGSANMSVDLGALVGKISAAGLDPERIIFIAAAEQANSIKVAAGSSFNHRVIGANLTPGTVIAVSAAGLAVSGGGEPRVDISKFADLHMEDTAPAHIGTAGVPPTVAAPSINLFQTAVYGLRVVASVCWVAASGSVAVATGCSW